MTMHLIDTRRPLPRGRFETFCGDGLKDEVRTAVMNDCDCPACLKALVAAMAKRPAEPPTAKGTDVIEAMAEAIERSCREADVATGGEGTHTAAWCAPRPPRDVVRRQLRTRGLIIPGAPGIVHGLKNQPQRRFPMPDYAEKMPTGYGALAGAARNAVPQPPSEAGQIETELREITALIDGVEASVSYARNQLWGPMPEKADRAGPSVVEPSGFLPSTLHRVRVIRHRLQALAEAAGNLRNI